MRNFDNTKLWEYKNAKKVDVDNANMRTYDNVKMVLRKFENADVGNAKVQQGNIAKVLQYQNLR